MEKNYLEDAGIDVDVTDEEHATDNKSGEWGSQVEEYGFAARELWSLDITMVYLLYDRLSMWVDQDFAYSDETCVTIDGVDATLVYWIKEILSLCQSVLDDSKYAFPGNDNAIENVKKIWTIWSEISPMMWL